MAMVRVILSETDLKRLRVIYHALAKSTWRDWLFRAGDQLRMVSEGVTILERVARQDGVPAGSPEL